ncbi:LemA family protein [Candidatus Saccharibacteria bacterium]|nr:LemA family protein [Candidatus Saccharibacteria bacterium]
MESLWIVVGLAVVLGLFLVITYNALVTLRNRVDEAWSDISVQLKRRVDLIPNLVNTVKGYAKHEKTVFQAVTEARAAVVNAGSSPKEAAKADNMLTDALKSVFAVAEAYPDLKASQNFSELQQELVDTEDKIQAARRFYNSGVRDYNTKIQMFPNNLIAGSFGFVVREFFELDAKEKEKAEKPVEVDFDK